MLKVNSKKVLPGDTFLALKGSQKDGENYIEEAIDNGAACIISSSGDYSVKTITVNDTRAYLSNYLKELNMEKFKKIKIIGIIGTYGKTSTGNILYQLLNNASSKTAFLGTSKFLVDDKIQKTKETTPDIYDMYEMINKAVDSDCENIIIELSNGAIKNRHIEGLRFDMLVYTGANLTNVKDEEKPSYINNLIETFKSLNKDGIAIINKNDDYHEYLTFPQNKNLFYGSLDSDYIPAEISLNYDKTYIKVNEDKFIIPLIGAGHVNNFLAAYSAISSMEYEKEEILKAVSELKQVDGRYQGIKYKESLIIIDYAFIPSLIKNVIDITRGLKKGKIITVIGAGGDRRKELRQNIGRLVTEETDYTIFTTDNPRYEEPEKIIEDIVKNVDRDNYEIIVSRKEAIKKGIDILEENDILLILGKGDEDGQIIGNDSFPFKDYNEVLKHVK